MKKTLNIFVYFFALTFIVSSCVKTPENTTPSGDVTSALDNAIAEGAFNDILAQIENVAESETGLRSANGIAACGVITIDTLAFPMTISIDYGSTNCIGLDGRLRRGKVSATLTGKYRDAGTKIIIAVTNYYLNDYKIEGTKTLTNEGRNQKENLWYSIDVENVVITIPNTNPAQTITWESLQTREWIAGESTVFNFLDDEYLIDGTTSGVDRNGASFTATITSPLHVKLSCPNIVSGRLDLTPNNLSTWTINYGNGVCDKKATVTIQGYVFDILLH